MVQKNKTNEKNIERVEFHVSYSCRNNCVFCSEYDQMRSMPGHFVDKAIFLRNIRNYAQKGARHITLTGGEPSLHPDFLDMIRLAKGMGLTVYVSSNGGKFASGRFCRAALPHIDEISFSLHGPDAAVHNAHTRNNKSFDTLMRAIRNIERAPFTPALFINTVVTNNNIDALERTVRLATRIIGIKQILVSNVAPEGRARQFFKELAVPLERLQDKAAKLALIAEQAFIKIRFFGMPVCSLDWRPDLSNDLHWTPRTTLELWKNKNRTFLKETTTLAPDRNRKKTQKCRACFYRDACGGVFELYLSTFGYQEIKPCAR
ncbi:MAG TPA: hypothetical protein DCL35_02645 [Candidatus Omnitrophica bacterium]|nr:hypothetical protein [Candidatus Omnitrophota bacterium]